jgi:hypothetical protein
MYGPFWLCTTLILVMAIAGNMGAMMSFVPTEEDQATSAYFLLISITNVKTDRKLS